MIARFPLAFLSTNYINVINISIIATREAVDNF